MDQWINVVFIINMQLSVYVEVVASTCIYRDQALDFAKRLISIHNSEKKNASSLCVKLHVFISLLYQLSFLLFVQVVYKYIYVQFWNLIQP